LASWTPSIIQPLGHCEVLLSLFPFQATAAAQEGVDSDCSGYVRAWSACFKRFLRHLSVPLLPATCLLLHRRALRIQASESKPDTPGICPDPAAAQIVFGELALSVSEASRAATAHSGVMAHVS